MRGVSQREHTYPMSAEEAVVFGWAQPGEPTPIVMTTRSPLGGRVIPTRELVDGAYVYGFVETRERPTHVEVEPWELEYGSDDEPHLGLLM